MAIYDEAGIAVSVMPLVVHHSGFDVLIPSHSRMGKFSGGKRISMLRGNSGLTADETVPFEGDDHLVD